MSGDPIARLLADIWVEQHKRPETDVERLDREEREVTAREGEAGRQAAFSRALDALEQGSEALRADIALFCSDPDLHLEYLDAYDDALAQHGGHLSWARRRAHGEFPMEGDV